MKNKLYNIFGVLLVLSVFTFGFTGDSGKSKITADEVLAHIKYLASDELGGRFPGTKGDSLTEDYIIKQFKSYK
ncbi:MAG TPA: hypothetical protein VGK25_10070, partial [Ignavibacteria bacterium]